MLLRVAGYTKVKLRSRMFDRRSVGKVALIEACHLTNQVGGVCMTARSRRKLAVLLGFVTT